MWTGLTTAIFVAATLELSSSYLRPISHTGRSNFMLSVATVDPNLVPSNSDIKSTKRQSLDVRIDDTWYDLSGWRKAHPAGEHWLDLYQGRDATEVMHGFHSDKARVMFQRLPRSKEPTVLEESAAKVTQVTRNFRAFRDRLEADGWWRRDFFHEARLFGIWASVFFSGLYLAKTVPLLAIVLIAVGNTAAGWIGHDYVHGVDKFSSAMRNFAAIAAGMSPCWWSDKHNKHHAVTNEVGVDEDLATEPLLYVYPPTPAKDNILRKIQHWTLPIPFSLLFAVWRIDSMKLCIKDALSGFKRKTQWELVMLLAHYAIVTAFVPIPIFLSALTLSGFMTAVIVTVTHQSEELFHEHNPHFVDAQFKSTRNAKCANIFTDWLWGGMQWQLEHHLFPSMPRSKYPALSKLVQQFAKENGLDYRISDEWDILKLNWDMYRKNSNTPADVNAKHFEGKEVNWGGRGERVPV